MSDNHRTLTAAKAAVLILEAATEAGLPDARRVGTTGGTVDISVHSVPEFVAWCEWRADLEVTSARTVSDNGTIWYARGAIFEQPVEVAYVEFDHELVTA